MLGACGHLFKHMGRFRSSGFRKEHDSTFKVCEARIKKIRRFLVLVPPASCSSAEILEKLESQNLKERDHKRLLAHLQSTTISSREELTLLFGLGGRTYETNRVWETDEFEDKDKFGQIVKMFMVGFLSGEVVGLYEELDGQFDVHALALHSGHAKFRARKCVISDVSQFVLYGKLPERRPSSAPKKGGAKNAMVLRNKIGRHYDLMRRLFRQADCPPIVDREKWKIIEEVHRRQS